MLRSSRTISSICLLFFSFFTFLTIFLGSIYSTNNKVYAQQWCDGGCNPDYATCQDCPTGQICSFNVCINTSCTSDTQCGGTNVCCQGQCVGAGQCGGDGGSCASPADFGINCPPGTVQGPTRVNRQCIRPSYCPGPGTAQQSNVCCQFETTGGECGDFYCCRYNSYNQCIKTCRDCEPEETFCVWNYIDTYECIPVCSVTPASGLSYSNGSITWTPGSNATSQRLYVSTTSTDVTNNCGTGTSCTTNLTLATNITGHTFSPTLTPSTTYYVRLVSYENDSCVEYTSYNFITAAPNNPWWQVRDGDITTNQSISSNVPSGALFNTVGLGGFPGVPVYGLTFNLLPTYPTRVSTTVWNANTTTKQTRLFNYEFFEKLITDDIVFNDITILPSGTGATSDSNGYEWYRVTGNLDTSGDIDIGIRKVILFVDSGNLTIGGRINLTDNQGFFGAFVNGSITVGSTVTGTPSIEGIYLSDGTFSSSVGTTQLHVRGSVASFGGMSLGRDLPNNTNPAELFEFAPDQLVLFPEKLMNKRAKWTEVAP